MHLAVATIKADLAQAEFGLTGRGIVWAVLGTGVDGGHRHFQAFRNLELPEGLSHLDYTHIENRRSLLDGTFEPLDAAYYVGQLRDPHGGTTALAGLIAGESLDGRGRPMRGVVPQATVLSVRVLDEHGMGSEASVIAGLRAIQRLNEGDQTPRIHGVLIGLSLDWDRRNYACGQSPVCVEVDRLVNSGVVVVASAGNRGMAGDSDMSVEGGITDPGNADLAITVGATHRTAPQIYGASYFSSRGPTADGRHKPDLLAPGEKLTVCWTDDGVQRRDGTDLAAALVSGAAGALFAANPDLIGKPKDVKSLLTRTAIDLEREATYQGHGLLDVMAAVRAAAGEPALAESGRTAERRVKIFCSYAHEDASLFAELKAHLTSLERAEVVEVWSDELIEAGTDWEQEIYDHLDAADIVLLLVSAFFVASDFCYSKELERALERKAKVIPIRARPVTLAGTPLQGIQGLPEQPVTSFDDPHAAWASVTEQLFEIAQGLRDGPTP